jgi:hypothetical protein
MSDPTDMPAHQNEVGAPFRRTMAWILGVVVFFSGFAFVYKLYEFFHDLTNEDGLHFAGSHLLTYCLVAGGFLLLLLYGFLRGHFADIEKPKYDLLEREERYDRDQFDRS